ncbi:MAG: LamG domain-containing protein [Gammaproteobacteria bacterium]|uniref:LamG-like jellyroll fold domain-containing protein n=1 Tax=Thioclava marina TaxID=1915077 RepID=A0ABX3MK47_9RHOB|nr:LamG domain-containing protein [Thioclava marina]MBD3754134.1 LamG domain-containing protein [Gammaproteobacteria bacterium]OOY11782.1 hypothetical protein BMG00_11895 [Thioclava marina]
MIQWEKCAYWLFLVAFVCAAFGISSASPAYAACANPTGMQGEIIYNSSAGFFQGCKADDTWQALHGNGPGAPPTNGLVGYWSMDDISGTTVVDGSGNGNDGSWVSDDSPALVKTAPGMIGNAASFDGLGDGIFLENTYQGAFSFASANAFTISAWTKLAALQANTTVFTRGGVNTASDGTTYALFTRAANKWTTNISDGTSQHIMYDTTEIDSQRVDQWTHFTVTWDGTSFILYKNGTIVSTSAPGLALWESTTQNVRGTSIGAEMRDISTVDNEFNGLIDEVYVYDRALSGNEVENVYLSAAPEIGYFVLIGNQPTNVEGNEFTGNLGGLSGANSTCLSWLTTYDWLGSSIANRTNMLTESNVKAWLCDDSECQNFNPNTQYAFGKTEAGEETTGGMAFAADANGLYPSADTDSWDTDQYFARWTYYWTGRAADFSADIGNTCNNWTLGTGGSGRRGDTSSNSSTRWNDTTQSCGTTDQFACFVNPQTQCSNPTGNSGEIIYNSSERVFQGCALFNWIALHAAGSGGGGCSNPSGQTGEIMYNSSFDAFQGCTFDGWVAFH